MTDQKTRIAVGLSDSLPDVLKRLRASTETSVSLDIPAASSLFLTASEFRALQTTADNGHIAVSVTTDDPLRQQLAALFKLPVEAPTSEVEPSPLETELPPPEESQPEEAEPRAESKPQPSLLQEVADTIAPPSLLRRGRLSTKSSSTTAAPRESDTSDTSGTAGVPPIAETPETSGRLSRLTARARATTTRQRLIAAGALFGVLVIAYLAAYLFLTRATVILTLKRQSVSRDLIIAVAAPNTAQTTGADLTIAATPITFAVSTTQTVNATGSKTVGDAPAQGAILLSNPTGKSVTIEAGTQLEDKITGTKYAIASTVDVVAGKDGAPGYGEAQVTCLEPGAVGNRDVGLLSGQLPNGIYYANRESPIAGGTDKTIPIVTQADLNTLQTKSTDDMKALAAQQSPGPDQVILSPTIQLSQPTFTFDHQVDQESPTVTVQASAQVSALTFSPTNLNSQVADALASTALAGFEVDRSTIQLSAPSATNGDAQTVLLTIHADATALAALTPDNRDHIAGAIAGKDEQAARTYLATQPGVESFEIAYSPGWLPHRIPSSSSRIEVDTR